MSKVDEALLALSIAYNKQFNIDLDVAQDDGEIFHLVDGTSTGVTRIGSVRANWLKRNSPRFGFIRQGETNAFQWSDSVIEHEVAAPVAAEQAEVAAVVTAAEILSENEDVDVEPDEGSMPLRLHPIKRDEKDESDDD